MTNKRNWGITSSGHQNVDRDSLELLLSLPPEITGVCPTTLGLGCAGN